MPGLVGGAAKNQFRRHPNAEAQGIARKGAQETRALSPSKSGAHGSLWIAGPGVSSGPWSQHLLWPQLHSLQAGRQGVSNLEKPKGPSAQP